MTANKWQIIDKLLQINFDVNTFVYCLRTNFVHSFSFLRNWSDNLIQLVLFVLDYHQWALILLLLLVPKWPYWPPNSKGLAFVKNINAILHKLLNLGFRNFRVSKLSSDQKFCGMHTISNGAKFYCSQWKTYFFPIRW